MHSGSINYDPSLHQSYVNGAVKARKKRPKRYVCNQMVLKYFIMKIPCTLCRTYSSSTNHNLSLQQSHTNGAVKVRKDAKTAALVLLL